MKQWGVFTPTKRISNSNEKETPKYSWVFEAKIGQEFSLLTYDIFPHQRRRTGWRRVARRARRRGSRRSSPRTSWALWRRSTTTAVISTRRATARPPALNRRTWEGPRLPARLPRTPRRPRHSRRSSCSAGSSRWPRTASSLGRSTLFRWVREDDKLPSGGLTLIVATQKWGFSCKVQRRPPANILLNESLPPKTPLRAPCSWPPWPWVSCEKLLNIFKIL